MMDAVLVLILVLIAACSVNTSQQSKENKLNRMWENQFTKNEVIKVYGPSFDNVPNGITYRREGSKIPQYAFFFDQSNRVTDQFAMMDKNDLKKFKLLNKCEWEDDEMLEIYSDYTRHNPVGLCRSKRLKYEFKSDFGLFEVSQIKEK